MTTRRQAVGVLGGTFDPVHEGHLAIARRVLRALDLERLLMVLTARPPHKPAAGLTPYRHRAAMLDLAIQDEPRLERSRLESGEAVSYSIDTLDRLRAGDPPRDGVFVMGSDSLLDLPGWREAERLVATYDLCVYVRPEEHPLPASRVPALVRDRLVPLELDRGVARDCAALAPGRGGRVFVVPGEPLDVSSSLVRAAAARGDDLAGLVPPTVAGYIHASGLYGMRDAATRPPQPESGTSPPQHAHGPSATPGSPRGNAPGNGGRALTQSTPDAMPPALALCVEAALDKKAEDLVVLDLRGKSDVTDYFVICHGNSDRQVLAIAEGIEERLGRELRQRPTNVEGRGSAQWVLMDFIDFVVHVFLAERREFYRLESLWGDAKRIDVEGSGSTSSAAG